MLDSPFKLFRRTLQFDEENFAAGGFNHFQSIFNKAAPHATVKGKGKDQPVQLSLHGLREYCQPNLLPQLDERLAAELEDRFNQINGQVIVENFKACKPCKPARDGQFPAAWKAVKEDKFHS